MSEFRLDEGTGFTACGICKEVIDKGEDRLTANLGSGYYPKSYHALCFVKRYNDVLVRLFELNKPVPKTCPNCGSEDITVDDVSHYPTGLTEDIHCDNCGYDYHEHYSFKGWEKK